MSFSSSSSSYYRRHLALHLSGYTYSSFGQGERENEENNECVLCKQFLSSSHPYRRYNQFPDKTLDAPGIVQDSSLNLLDWGHNNHIAIGLSNSVYVLNADSGSSYELLSLDEGVGPVTSVSWAPCNSLLAVGTSISVVELWDVSRNKKVQTLCDGHRDQDGHRVRVGSLCWNNQILTTGGMDSRIIDNDVRSGSSVQVYNGHRAEVCGLKWSSSGRQLASGGTDKLLYIWDRNMVSSSSRTQWLHKFNEHKASVRALAWCMFKSDLLASGGGWGDGCIKFWNTRTGTCLNSIKAGSEVGSLLWSKNERNLLSSNDTVLNLWKYPSMVKIAEFIGHMSNVLYMDQSPDGCKVASATGDETLRLWNLSIRDKRLEKKTANRGLFASFNHIR